MAALDLEQQEQIDQFKQLWKTYGNLLIWVLTLALLAYAGWTWYQHRENQAAAQDAVLFDNLEQSLQQGDAKRAAAVFADMQQRHPKATYTAHGALLLAQYQSNHAKDDEAKAVLSWMIDHAKQENLVAIARLRLASLLLDAKQYDHALTQLQQDMPAEFKALAQDRQGDILSAQGKKAQAIQAYQQAYDSMDKDLEYRRLIEGKLTILGAAPAPAPSAAQASAPQPS